MQIITKKWKEIELGDKFLDGSKVIEIHDPYEEECYKLHYKYKFKNYEIELSKSHLLLCDISKIDDNIKDEIEKWSEYGIPTVYDQHIYVEDENDILDILNNKNIEPMYEPVEWDNVRVEDNLYWLPIEAINWLLLNKQKVTCNDCKLTKSEYIGIKTVQCVMTDTHQYQTNHLIHHNSVSLRNIIFHCLTHSSDIAIALIDLKYTEFSIYKGVKNVVAVANTVQEAAEIMRVARECMYKRNQELAKLGLTDIKDHKPQEPTDEVIVCNRKLNDNDTVEIELPNGERKIVTVKELESYL